MAHPNEAGGGRPRARARPRGGPAARALAHAVHHAPGFQPPAMQQPPAAEQVQQPPVDPYDPSADPTLQRIKAFGANRLAQAQAAAISSRQQAEADYADTQAADTRSQHDEPIALSAGQSKANLGYSSTGAQQQSDLSRALVATANQHQRDQQDRLNAIQGTLQGVQEDVAGQDIQAQQDAADRLRERLGDLSVGGAQGGAGNVRGARARTGPAAQAAAALARRQRGRHAPIPHLPAGRRP